MGRSGSISFGCATPMRATASTGRAHPPRASHARPCLGGHHGPLPARKTHRQLRPVSRGVRAHVTSRRQPQPQEKEPMAGKIAKATEAGKAVAAPYKLTPKENTALRSLMDRR